MSNGNNFSAGKRLRVSQKTYGQCWYCGTHFALDRMTVDHINPRMRGGHHNMDNLVPCYRSCNCSKRTRSLEEFRDLKRRERSDWASKGVSFNERQLEYLESLGLRLPEPPPHRFWYEERYGGEAAPIQESPV